MVPIGFVGFALVRLGLMKEKVFKGVFLSVFLVFGLLMASSQLQRWFTWQGIGPDAAHTRSISGKTAGSLGAWYQVIIDGQRHSCPGGTKQPSGQRVSIRYHPDHPERCREDRFADGMGSYELTNAVMSAGFALGSIWLFVGFLWKGRSSDGLAKETPSEP